MHPRKTMEDHYVRLFHAITTLCSFIVFFFFTQAISAPAVPQNITEVMRNDPNLCETSKFLYDSEYTKLCASISYPTVPWNFVSETLNSSLCIGIYDTAYKICQYQNSNRSKIPIDAAAFNSYVEQIIRGREDAQEQQLCNNLRGLTSLYNKTDSLWKPLVTGLNNPVRCLKICFDYKDEIHPLCAVLAWIKTIDDNVKEANRIGKYDSIIPDKPPLGQSNDETASDVKKPTLTGAQTAEMKETKKQSIKDVRTNLKDIAKKINSYIPDNVPSANDAGKSIIKKPNEIRKKINDTLNTQVHKLPEENKENIIDIKPETDIGITKNSPQDSSINNIASNVPNKHVNEDKVDESNKKQGNDDLKTSTISENTQDHYNGNQDEDMETNIGENIDDMDDTIQQPIDTGNQNENVQEVIEQKNNLHYPNMRTEDDSHFFTYFTVIIIACLAGYIGYHNKQKILAIVLEGRRSRSNRGRRRPSTASYRKLDCTLEEAVTSQCNANVTHVIY